MRPSALASVAFGLVALSGCGSDDPERVILDTERVERSIEQSVKEQRNLEADVSCPVNIEQKKGNDFTCVAKVRGKEFEFRVTQTDSEGHVTYEGV
jgi:hypothetical protein